jgi:cytochrome c556
MNPRTQLALLLAFGLAAVSGGCRTTPEQTEARLERQLKRFGEELESLTDAATGQSPAQVAERKRRLEAEIRKTLAALTRHLETMAAQESEPTSKAQRSGRDR